MAFESGTVPEDWKDEVCTFSKVKSSKGGCKNYRGISLLSVDGKVYDRILINRVKRITQKPRS